MKIAIITLRSRFGSKVGDMVQAEKTCAALRDLGHAVVRYYIEPNLPTLYDEDNQVAGAWSQTLSDVDVVHIMPPFACKFLRGLPKLAAKLVCSTVFWRSLTYTRVAHRNVGRLNFTMLKDYVRTLLAWTGLPTYDTFSGYDVLLPNSEDEAVCVRRYCKIKRNAVLQPVPNAVDELPQWVDGLERSHLAPSEEYIACPAYFAPRKNQQEFIKALYDTDYKVVFMGEGPLLDRCKKIASANMAFLGHIGHGTRDFYSLLKYARVVCLPSNCETPGIAGLEGAALGARPVIPYEGGTAQYYGWDAEYLDPLSKVSMRSAIERAWRRGRLSKEERMRYQKLTWSVCARKTCEAYECNV